MARPARRRLHRRHPPRRRARRSSPASPPPSLARSGEMVQERLQAELANGAAPAPRRARAPPPPARRDHALGRRRARPPRAELRHPGDRPRHEEEDRREVRVRTPPSRWASRRRRRRASASAAPRVSGAVDEPRHVAGRARARRRRGRGRPSRTQNPAQRRAAFVPNAVRDANSSTSTAKSTPVAASASSTACASASDRGEVDADDLGPLLERLHLDVGQARPPALNVTRRASPLRYPSRAMTLLRALRARPALAAPRARSSSGTCRRAAAHRGATRAPLVAVARDPGLRRDRARSPARCSAG